MLHLNIFKHLVMTLLKKIKATLFLFVPFFSAAQLHEDSIYVLEPARADYDDVRLKAAIDFQK